MMSDKWEKSHMGKNTDISNAGHYRREEKGACKKDILAWGLEPPR